MIEILVKDYLEGALQGVPIFLELPEVPSEDFPEWPDEYVLIEKVGERIRNHVRTPSVALQSYSLTSLYNAAALDERVREAMDAMTDNALISSARMASNYNFTDTSTKRYRYQCVYDIVPM